jgi:hypothetical protein
MDITGMFFQSLLQVWYILPVLVVIFVLQTPWFKGIFGEFQVNLILKRLPQDEYHLIKDVTLPTENGTTQIDHVVVSQYGVFVIETKNMKGWIFGSANQRQWTQRIFKHSSKFQNPIHQNYKHLKTIETLLDIDQNALFSVIVFIGGSTFKTEMPSNVTYASGCLSYIYTHSEKLLSHAQVNEVIQGLESGRLERGFSTNKAHKSHVREIKQQKAGSASCPKCGAHMILREAKKGPNAGSKFWGCSNFPRCRGILKSQ